MENDMEPIFVMAKFLYEVSGEGAGPWEELPESSRWYWAKTAAQAWEVYWMQREYLERRPH
jgi:hypothetical protein